MTGCTRPSTASVAPWRTPLSRYEATLSRCGPVTSGPISDRSSDPGPTRRFAIRSEIRLTSSSPTGSTATRAETAMQRSPAEPNPADTAASAARSRSASGSTTMWFLAPPRACTRLPLAVPFSYTYLAMGVEPTKLTALMSGCSRMASTATLSPCTTLNTPSGSPASAHSAASSSDAEGSFSDGLSTNVLPQAIASGNIHIGTMAGKLNGVMPATTPTGCLIEYESTPVETFSENPPLSRCGMPQANSTTSRPRATSPAASEATLPCSSVISCAISLARDRMSSRNANSTEARLASETRRQVWKASLAASTARSTSVGVAKSTWPLTCPVAGS